MEKTELFGVGNANNSPLADRDNVALNFKYRF